MVTPATATIDWIRSYFHALEEGMERDDALAHASRTADVSGKGFARIEIKTGTLTIPVEGGAGILKRRSANPTLSEHGKWRREHLGALNAAYGRTPFYEHLMPDIAQVYESSVGETLESFNRRLLDIALRWLEYEQIVPEKERLQNIAAETKVKVNERLSIFDAIFRLGKESVFALIYGS